MNILDNELVRKYFKCECFMAFDEKRINHGPAMTNDCVAGKIIHAMQEPIKKGERYLQYTVYVLGGEGQWTEQSEPTAPSFDWHPFALRLPDRFQKQEKRAEDFPECQKEEITWQGDFNGKKIVMTANHVIWLGEKPTPEPDLSWKCHCGVLYPSELHKQNCKPKDGVEEKL